MSDWNDGYITDIAYTFGYYPELNPLRTRLALLSSGWAAPTTLTDGPACELALLPGDPGRQRRDFVETARGGDVVKCRLAGGGDVREHGDLS